MVAGSSSAAHYNVEDERKDPYSIFNTYRRLLILRRTDDALRDGSQESINDDDKDVFTFVRRSGDRTVLVALNMSAHTRRVAFYPAATGVRGTKLVPLYSSPATVKKSLPLNRVELAPFGALVAVVQ